MSDRRFSHLAKVFLVRRAGMACDWDCTCADLSRLLDIPRSTIHGICQERGYPVRNDHGYGRPKASGPIPIDRMFERNHYPRDILP